MTDPTMTDPNANLPAVRHDLQRAGAGPLSPNDLTALERAVRALEHSSVATRLANAMGRQLGHLGKLLPIGVSGFINAAAERAIRTALGVALRSLEKGTAFDSRLRHVDTRFVHKAAAIATGAAGGAFGLASLPVELPLSTMIILRSIADIARKEGEDISDPEVALACLEVFALGARDKNDAFTDSGYFAVRSLLARTVSEAAKYIAAQGVSDQAAPILVRFVAQIGARFGIVVSEKLAAQALPIVGAAGGAAVNYAFLDHFQSLAHGHFTVRRLERHYGRDVVRTEYDRLLSQEKVAAA